MTGINRERNLVQVTYSFHTHKHDLREFSRTVTKEFSAADMPGKTALFREEERHLSAGGRIALLKNDAGLDVQNGADGTIRDIDQNGGCTPRPGRAGGPHRPQELPAPGPRLCTHRSQEPGRHGGTLDQHGIRIFNNSVEGLSRSVERWRRRV